ncbi:MAG: hypothetical protein ACLP8S_26800 [Solirubrobacteraceae bacterium]
MCKPIEPVSSTTGTVAPLPTFTLIIGSAPDGEPCPPRIVSGIETDGGPYEPWRSSRLTA